MKNVILLFIFLLSPLAAFAASSYFSLSAADVVKVLANPVFSKYADYTVDNIRQGEIGESQAYFVRLVKPFAADKAGVCFEFLGSKNLDGKPHPCDKAE